MFHFGQTASASHLFWERWGFEVIWQSSPATKRFGRSQKPRFELALRQHNRGRQIPSRVANSLEQFLAELRPTILITVQDSENPAVAPDI
ncbi:MAG: hypothetical protein DMG57_23970 [Acidobacteria bacterium]|nr:MAG: hypothetical protein DMG57_23970 [Acidobacteriota bacterium]